MKFDADKLRLRIRHFLLQKSRLYHRTVGKNNEVMPPVSTMASELSKVLDMPQRRIQKYLTEDLPPKEIAITIDDLFEFAKLNGSSLSEFVAYLTEDMKMNPLTEGQKGLIEFFSQLHEGHRRSLKATLFSSADIKKSERLVECIAQIYYLPDQDIRVIEEVVTAFAQRNRKIK